MIIKLELENIGPYSDNIVLDFRVNKRDKDNIETVVTLPDGEMITKIAGIIGGNAYGKTTLLRSLNAIGSFIDNPIINKKVSYYIENIKDEEIRAYFKEYGFLSLAPVNKKSPNNIGVIKIVMYIDNDDDFSGYYTYTLKYTNNYLKEGVCEESLIYKKKYKSKIEKEIFNIKNNSISEIGYKIAYKANLLNDLNGKAKLNLENNIKYYETFYNRFINESSTLGAENYIFPEEYIIDKLSEYPKYTDLVRKFINLADSDVKDIEIDLSDEQNKKLFFVYKNFKLRYSSISTATKKLCSIATNFYEATQNGGVFIIDELDNSLNKNVTKFLIGVYNNKVLNNTSQMIFTTNNSETLSNLRRDQIFIIEKNNDITNVVKYLNFIDKEQNKKSRKDWSFVKAYNENIIKNYPLEKNSNELIKYIKNMEINK